MNPCRSTRCRGREPAIVHVASGREWRGGQRQVWLLARELGRRGVDQVVVTTRDSELARRLDSAAVRVRAVQWGAGLDPRVLPAILRELRHRKAILHAHDAHAVTLAGLCAALSGAPLVATRRVTFPIRRKLFWQRAARVIAISGAVRDALTRDGLAPERVTLIPSAIDMAELRASRGPDIRTRFGLPQKGQVAVSLGALTPEKDQSTLLEAAALLVRDLPDLRWVIVGEGPLRSTLQRQAGRLGLEKRFHLVGQLADPHEALAGADVFVLSSLDEGLGSSVLAAMAFEVPVVATRVGGVPELLGSGGGVLVPARHPAEFAAAVHRVLSDPGYASNLKQAARMELGRFTVDAMAEQIVKVYRSCAHSLEGS
jgi:glycosyltransferase involved in cell wall biosynthesis